MEGTRSFTVRARKLSALPVVLSALALLGTIAASAPTAPAWVHWRDHRSVPLSPHGPILPETGALFGSSANHVKSGDEWAQDAVVAFEDLIGRKIAVKRQYHFWDDVFPTDFDVWERDRGTTLIMSWQTMRNGVPLATWADIAAGEYDSVIDARAADIKAFGAPLFFTLDHEPESGDPGQPADYVAAWRHLHDRFAADGVTNVSWVLILLSYTYQNDGADIWYPGDNYVDLLGADGYNWFLCPPGVWKEFPDLFQDFYDYGVAKGKPMMIAEWGSIEDAGVPGHKAQWFTSAAATLKTMPEIKVVSYYNNGVSQDANCDWWVDTSASSLAAFVAMGADPYFNPPPPMVMIDSRPPDLDKHTTATFAFHSNIPETLFTCAVDLGRASSCVSPSTVTALSQGAHTYTITATDPLSQTSSYEIAPWTVDSVPPVDTLLKKPKNHTQDTGATLQQSSNEPDPLTTFTCQLDAGKVESCSKTKTYSGLAQGVHAFTGTTTDPAGNVSAPLTYSWTVDTTPPTATITTGPASLSKSKSATFTFTSEPGATFKCSLDGGTFMGCSSPKTYWSLADGGHVLKVEAIDLAKNVGAPASWTWSVDATKPVVTITSGPPDPSQSSTATFKFTASEQVTSFTCQLDSQASKTCVSGVAYTGITNGRHTFKVYATDLAGNQSTTVTWSWTKQ